MSNILEMASRSKSGRKSITFIAHEVYQDNESTNKNGLHWKREYVEQNLDSLKGMPICAEFTDEDKEIPLGHGYTGTEFTEDGAEPLFENSVVVGTVEYGEVKNVVVDGREILALVCYGYIYTQRFPKFHEWLKKNKLLGNIDTSIEITGVDGGDIVYENNFYSKEFRTPQIYQYSGSAILSVTPADDSAIILEVAQDLNKEENKEMDEKLLKELIVSTINETNSAKEKDSKTISELNETIVLKDAEINELKGVKEESEKNICEKDKEINELKEQIKELQSKLDDATKKELNAELDDKLAKYSDEQKEYAKSEINSYRENPLIGNVDEIVAKICVGIVEKQLEDAKNSEVNSAKGTETVDIFSEVNSEQDEAEEDVNIF